MATVVAFHAHPDDEVLLTGGTIARLAAEGHRVIIVVACDGAVWDGPDRDRRLAELQTSAAIPARRRPSIWATRTAGTGRSCSRTRRAGPGSCGPASRKRRDGWPP